LEQSEIAAEKPEHGARNFEYNVSYGRGLMLRENTKEAIRAATYPPMIDAMQPPTRAMIMTGPCMND
jgi:hypothetical protein